MIEGSHLKRSSNSGPLGQQASVEPIELPGLQLLLQALTLTGLIVCLIDTSTL